MKSFRNFALAIALGLSPAVASASVANMFTGFAVFGDSLSDNGNLYAATGQPTSPPYFNGRFSNGPVWDEAIMSAFANAGETAVNFAFGGATASSGSYTASGIPGLPQQIATFAPGSAAFGANPLAAVWAGANDLFAALGANLTGSALDGAAKAAADAVVGAANALATDGVKNLLVLNLPDLGKIPAYALYDPAQAADATSATNAFNTELALGLSGLGLSTPGLSIHTVNINALFTSLLANPTHFGVSNVVTPCLTPAIPPSTPATVCTPGELAQDAFFDPVHPTEKIHDAIRAAALSAIGAVPLPLPAASLAGGLVILVFAGRRRRPQAKGQQAG